MAPGSRGTIDSNGLYHAPASFRAKQSFGGCQILPNDHILNSRIDSLPVNRNSATWMATAIAAGGSLNVFPSYPNNFVDSKTRTQQMVFAYTPGNNGPFKIPAYPEGEIENGWFMPPFGGQDRHLLVEDPASCTLQEMYNYYPAGSNGPSVNNCPSCTSQSGVIYSNLTYTLAVNGGVDAASLYFYPLNLHYEDIQRALAAGRTIDHAYRITLSGNAFDPTGAVWPAMGSEPHNSKGMPYGSRIRLKNTFNGSQYKNPITQLLIKQLMQYGLFVADIGSQWTITSDDRQPPTREMASAFNDISHIAMNEFEVVDESKLMISRGSGKTYEDAETVIATNRSGKNRLFSIILAGVSVGVHDSNMLFQAGGPPTQLHGWVHGSTNTGINWTMNPRVGTLTPSGVYTPPPTIPQPTTVTVTATASADPAEKAFLFLTVLPPGTIRIASGWSSNYTDSHGNIWWHGLDPMLSNIGAGYPYYSYLNNGTWPKLPDIRLAETPLYNYGDLGYLMNLPNGNYKVSLRTLDVSCAPDSYIHDFEAQGQIVYHNLDMYAVAGCHHPLDLDMPAIVSDGELRVVVRPTGNSHGTPLIGAPTANIVGLQVTRDTSAPHLSLSPTTGSVSVLQSIEFYPVGWYMPNRVTWSISPQIGVIDANGKYTAPATPPNSKTAIVVTARSSVNQDKSATATLTLLPGVPPIRINCGGGAFTDAAGHYWESDHGMSGVGHAYDQGAAIKHMPDSGQGPLYTSSMSNYAEGTADEHIGDTFTYTFPVPAGTYKVTLKWAEFHGKDLGLNMNVRINGQQLLSNFNPVAAAAAAYKDNGLDDAYDRTFTTTATNGQIRIDFISRAKAPSSLGAAINGIEVEYIGPASSPQTRPAR